jgi:hypothetical protein
MTLRNNNIRQMIRKPVRKVAHAKHISRERKGYFFFLFSLFIFKSPLYNYACLYSSLVLSGDGKWQWSHLVHWFFGNAFMFSEYTNKTYMICICIVHVYVLVYWEHERIYYRFFAKFTRHVHEPRFKLFYASRKNNPVLHPVTILTEFG